MGAWTAVKLLHVLAGTLWIGSVVMVMGFILPAARSLGPAAGPMMGFMMNTRRLPVMINSSAWLAVLTGAAMIAYYSPTLDALRSVWGLGLMIGAGFGLAAFLWGLLVQSRNAKKLSEQTRLLKGPPSPDQAAAIALLQTRLQNGAYVGVGLLLVSLVGMIMMHPI